MGFLFSKIFNLLPGTKETRIAMIGNETKIILSYLANKISIK